MGRFTTKIIESFNKFSLLGIISCIIFFGVGFYFKKIYEDKIPYNAQYEDVIERYKDQNGDMEVVEYIDYENDDYNDYAFWSKFFMYLPLSFGIFLTLILPLLQYRFKTSTSDLGKDEVLEFKTSKKYKLMNPHNFENYVGFYFLSLFSIFILLIVFVILLGIFDSIF